MRLCFFSDTAFNTRGLPCIDGHQLPLWIDKGARSKHPVFYLDRGTFIVYAKWCGLVDGVLQIFFLKERHCRKIIDFFFQIKKRENVKKYIEVAITIIIRKNIKYQKNCMQRMQYLTAGSNINAFYPFWNLFKA